MVVLFQPFRALPVGRIVCCVITGIVLIAYTWITVRDYVTASLKRKPPLVSKMTVTSVAKPHWPKGKVDIESDNRVGNDNVDFQVCSNVIRQPCLTSP